MGPDLAILIAVAAFLAVVLLEVPVAVGIAIGGLLGITLLDGLGRASSVLATAPYNAVAKYSLFIIPMYVLLGALVSHSGIGAGIYRVANRLVHRLPGGLAAGAVLATASFSGISGSSAADVASFGRVSVAEMTRHGYARAEAAAIVAAAGAMAMLIPPSIVLVIYGVIAQLSIGAMILAAVVPGALSALALAGFLVGRQALRRVATTAVAAAQRPVPVAAAGPPVPGEIAVEAPGAGGSATRGGDLISVLAAVVLFAIVVGGLYSGIFTATEAGAVAAFVALVITASTARTRLTASRWTVLRTSLRETVDVTAMIFLLLVAGSIFAYFVASSGLAQDTARWVLGLPVAPAVVLIAFLLAMLPLGMFLDGLSILLLTVPIVAPVVVELGFDGVWFGILMIKMIEIGLITPPVGINVFIIAGIAGIPAESVFRRVLPFVLLDLTLTAIFFAVPELVLWLPRLAGMG